ncbi:MAG: DUF134 domain-containing protein [Desulfomicrobium sp.]
MGRRRKCRFVADVPAVTVFKPVGVPMGQLHGVVLGLDGFEAMRLVDGEGMSQEEAAARMRVSRPTLCRILGEARTQVARALSRGWALRVDVDGGHTVTGADFEETTPCCRRGRGCARGAEQTQGEGSCRDEQGKVAEEDEDRAVGARVGAARAADAVDGGRGAVPGSAPRAEPDRDGCVATDPA